MQFVSPKLRQGGWEEMLNFEQFFITKVRFKFCSSFFIIEGCGNIYES